MGYFNFNFKKESGINKKNNSISLSLSGGGARGAIHIGVLQALWENNIKIEAIAGVSIGAIIGAFFSAGVQPLQMKKIMETQSFTKLFHFSWNKKGLLKMDILYDIMDKYIPDVNFDNLKIPFHAGLSNLDTGQFEIMNSGNLKKAVAASSSIPVIFEPVLINEHNYVDGGLFNNMPVEPLLNTNSFVLGIHVNNFKPSDELTFITVAERVFTLVILNNAKENFKKCDYLINPFLEKDYGLLDFKYTDILFNIGYVEGLKFVELWKTN
jgi:NTE family protein